MIKCWAVANIFQCCPRAYSAVIKTKTLSFVESSSQFPRPLCRLQGHFFPAETLARQKLYKVMFPFSLQKYPAQLTIHILRKQFVINDAEQTMNMRFLALRASPWSLNICNFPNFAQITLILLTWFDKNFSCTNLVQGLFTKKNHLQMDVEPWC